MKNGKIFLFLLGFCVFFVPNSFANNSFGDNFVNLQEFNLKINKSITFKEDIDNWGEKDYWATPNETMMKGFGDCEDYAILKYFSLKEMGVSSDNMRIVYVKHNNSINKEPQYSKAHMVLSLTTKDNKVYILDNLIDNVLLAEKRWDLQPVFSFNDNDIYDDKNTKKSSIVSLSKWQNLLMKYNKENQLNVSDLN